MFVRYGSGVVPYPGSIPFWFRRFPVCFRLLQVTIPMILQLRFSMTSFPWQINRIRLPIVSTLSRRLHTSLLPETHAAVGISRTTEIAFRNHQLQLTCRTPPPCPTPDKIFVWQGFLKVLWNNSEIPRPILYPNRVRQGAGRSPGSVSKFQNTSPSIW